MFGWIKRLLRKMARTTTTEPPRPPADVRFVSASAYDRHEIGEIGWNAQHNGDRLTVTADGLTVEWDPSKNPEGEKLPPCWVPSSTRLRLHSGQFTLDFRIEEMAERQIGVGFMLELTDGVHTGGDWGFFGYLGSSNTAWAYDPSTGDVVTATASVEGGLPKLKNGHTGVVQLRLILPREGAGMATFVVDGVKSRPVVLPVGAVVLPAACLLKTGQRISLANFARHADG